MSKAEVDEEWMAGVLLAVAGAKPEQAAAPVLSPIQQRAMLSYRLIRNGLGNYGGRGDDFGDRALLPMTQRVTRDGHAISLQITGLPEGAEYVQLHWRNRHHESEMYKQNISESNSEGTTQVIEIDKKYGIMTLDLVEVFDTSRMSIASGVPVAQVDTTTGCEK